MKLMLKHQQRNYFFYSFPHMSNFALLSFFLLLFLFFFLLGPDKPNITSSKGGRRVGGAVKFNYGLRVSAPYRNIFVAFSARKGAS